MGMNMGNSQKTPSDHRGGGSPEVVVKLEAVWQWCGALGNGIELGVLLHVVCAHACCL